MRTRLGARSKWSPQSLVIAPPCSRRNGSCASRLKANHRVARTSNYDKFPYVAVPDSSRACVRGWPAISARLKEKIAARASGKVTIVIECYLGVDEEAVLSELSAALRPAASFRARDAMLPPTEIDQLVAPFLGGDDPVFGFLCGLKLPQFFDPLEIDRLRK